MESVTKVYDFKKIKIANKLGPALVKVDALLSKQIIELEQHKHFSAVQRVLALMKEEHMIIKQQIKKLGDYKNGE